MTTFKNACLAVAAAAAVVSALSCFGETTNATAIATREWVGATMSNSFPRLVFEAGGLAVYTNGVKAGTVQFAPAQ